MASNLNDLKSLAIAWIIAGTCALCLYAERMYAASYAMLLESMNDCKKHSNITQDLESNKILQTLVALSWLAFVAILLLIGRPRTAFGFMVCLLGAIAICTSSEVGLAHCLHVFVIATFLSPVAATIGESSCWAYSTLTSREE